MDSEMTASPPPRYARRVNPMAARRFVCRACGHLHAAWAPRCSSCLSLDGLVVAVPGSSPVAVFEVSPAARDAVSVPISSPEQPRPRLVIARAPSPDLEDPIAELADVAASSSLPVPLDEVAEEMHTRDSTGLVALDHVLGGGLVVASVVLLASPPGIGKSSLSLQMLHGLGHRCLYVTGEETQNQVAMTARRIGATSPKVYVVVERSLDKIFAHARAIGAKTIAIDSIQKMICEDVGGRAGSATQLKECTARLVDFAKETGTTLWLIGHVTSDGDIAGPKTIEHDVDVVLELEQGTGLERRERLLRCPTKNRFGATNVVGRFELTAKGFADIDADGWNEPL